MENDGWEISSPRTDLRCSSVTMSLFTVLANIPHVPTLPSTLHQLHFRSGVECQYLENKVRLSAKTDVWNPSVPWNILVSRYENLLKEKKEVNSRIQSEEWAYRAALTQLENQKKERKMTEREL